MLCASMAVIQIYRNQPVFASFVKLPLNECFGVGSGYSASSNAIPWKTRAADKKAAGRIRTRLADAEPGRITLRLVRFRIAVTLGSTFRTVELSDRVGAHLCNAVLDAVTFVFSGAHRSLHHHVGTLR